MMKSHAASFCTIAFVLVGCATTVVHGQISVEEAQHRLQDKLAQKQPTTQPVSEIDRLRQENLRLRERVSSLQEEVTTLKESLARASAEARAASPATRPAEPTARKEDPVDPVQKPLLGHWRGGDITTGSGYLLTFLPDGTYQQLFTATSKKEAGQYRLLPQSVMEMWNDKWPEDKRHNQYQYAVNPVRLTLTPVIADGVEVTTAKAVVLTKAD